MSDNKALTLEQLREMDGEPVYVHNLFPAKRKFEWQWALVCKERGNAEATTYTYRFLDYGKTWIAYRRPPEGGEINKITVVQHLGRLEDVALRPVSREQVEKVWTGCEKCHNQDNWPPWIENGFVYCPKCGTPLTSWAWEKQMKRLEALKDGKG